MKKACYALLVLFVSTLVFTSCKKDKDDPSIVGKWEYYQFYTKTTEVGEAPEETTTNITTNSSNYQQIEFKADGSFIVTRSSNSGGGTYRVDGNKLYIKDTGDDDEYSYDLHLTENEFHFSDKEVEETYSIERTFKYKRI